MRKTRRTFAALAASLLLLLFIASSWARAEGVLHAADGEVADAGGPVLLRCVNLSAWLVPEPNLIGGALRAFLLSPIRGVDSQHMIFVEGDSFAHDFAGLGSLPDTNLAYAFQEYTLFNKAWKTPNQAVHEPFLQLRAATHRPIWLGEFGENTFEWQRQMVELMKANRIGWADWPWKRIDRHVGTPVIETIVMPKAWDELTRYLDHALFARMPTPAGARQGMSEMLAAIRSENCLEDRALANMLAGR